MATDDKTNETRVHQYPIPGSVAARDLGCVCSASRNHDGLRPPFAAGTHIGGASGGWLIARDCSLHVTSAYRGALVG